MAVSIKAPAEVPARPPRAIVRTIRKIGLLGSHGSSLTDCPWSDPSWELWGHASSRDFYKRALDCYFEMHRPERWHHPLKKGAGYPKWLERNTVPIYMHERYPFVPAALRYPKERILQEFSTLPRRYFTNVFSWMAALAITEGVTTLGVWGINYSAQSEYACQRGCAEFWLGVLGGRGIQVILPEQCSLLREPARLYGYDSHDEKGNLYPEFAVKEFKPAETIRPAKPGETVIRAQPPQWLGPQIAEEQALHPRPDWALKGA